jgi:Tfp pilus assembly protein PilV
MKLIFFVLLAAISFALPLESLEKENQKLSRTNGALLQALKELTASSEGQAEEAVGFYGTYKCNARNDCIAGCQDKDSTKTWYACMKECPKELCDKDSASDSMDPEENDSEEEAVGLTCSKDGFEGTVTSDSWCDKRDNVWMHKCSDCKHGYYWYWWHTYCCTPGKSGCTCAYN